MDSWRVFFLDLLSRLASRCPLQTHASMKTLIEMDVYFASVFPLQLFSFLFRIKQCSGPTSFIKKFPSFHLFNHRESTRCRVLKFSAVKKKEEYQGCAFGVNSFKRLAFMRAPKNANTRSGHKKKSSAMWMQMLKAMCYVLAVLCRASRVIV